MRRSTIQILLSFITLCTCVTGVLAQDDKKVLGEVTIVAVDPVYKGIRGLSALGDAFSGDYATVNNVVFKRDAAVFTLKTGEIYFLKPVEGRTTGAVFIGSGEF
jgi:hypothetical protein